MTFRSTTRSPFLLSLAATSFLGVAACSSSTPVTSMDAGADASKTHPDASDAGRETGADTGRDSAGDSGRDARADVVLGDAHHVEASDTTDAHPEASRDAAHDSGYDAGPPALRYVGRTLTDGTSPDGEGACTSTTPCFEWSGTQVIARVAGATSVAIAMSDNGNYFDVYVDGVLQTGSPIIGMSSQSSYTLATGLTASQVHEVRLYKRTEASTAGRTMIQGVTFPSGGMLLPPAEPSARRIEVIGDSISCGYGVLGPTGCTETPAYEDHDESYGAITAHNLGADLHTIASSGRGVYRNDDGTTTTTLPLIYPLTLPYSTPVSTSMWSFSSWVPQAVVIDLGTNDFVMGDPGMPFVTAYVAFLKQIRQSYPNAAIVATNGPMLQEPYNSEAQTYIKSAIMMVNDPKVTFLAFPVQSAPEGCDGHPGPATHMAMATQLTAALKTALGW